MFVSNASIYFCVNAGSTCPFAIEVHIQYKVILCITYTCTHRVSSKKNPNTLGYLNVLIREINRVVVGSPLYRTWPKFEALNLPKDQGPQLTSKAPHHYTSVDLSPLLSNQRDLFKSCCPRYQGYTI